MPGKITPSEIDTLKQAYEATLFTDIHADTILKIDTLLARLEKTSSPPEGIEALGLLANLAVTSIEHNNAFHNDPGNRERGLRTVRLLERWGCDSGLVKVVEGFYYHGRTFAITPEFTDIVASLMAVAKSESSIGLLAQMKKDIDANEGLFFDIGYTCFECKPDFESFGKAKTEWNHGRESNRVGLSLEQGDFAELAAKGSIQKREFWLSIKNGKLHLHNMEGQKIRMALKELFENMPATLREKIAVFGLDRKDMLAKSKTPPTLELRKAVKSTV